MNKEKKDKKLTDTIKYYSNIVQTTNNKAEVAGRLPDSLGSEKIIWDDIKYKLQLDNINSFLDIGCGCGALVDYCIENAKNERYDTTLLDFPEVVKKLKKMYENSLPKNIKIFNGFFPNEIPEKISLEKYDRILAYSVIHYTDHPKAFIMKTIELLKHNGIALFGDLPNMNKKGRFLSSEYGRNFEANFRKKKLSDIPKYSSHKEFLKKNRDEESHINDELMIDLLDDIRRKGYNVYICPQPIGLPFCYTREDLIIHRP